MVSVVKNDMRSNAGSAKRRILQATVSALARDGVDGRSIRRVAAEAGVSIGGVQHHYGSRNALLVGASEFITEQFKERAARLSESSVGNRPVDAFVAFCQLLANAESDSPNERGADARSEEHTSELQSRGHLVCRLLLEKRNAQREYRQRKRQQ